ncbi:CC-NBS-LRR resistance protein, partial [Trifolium pratense]
MEGETILSASVNALIDKLNSTEFVNNFWRIKLDHSLLTKLQKTLKRVLIVLDGDADAVVREALRYPIFEVVNLFDEINTEALRCKVKAQSQTLTPASQVLIYLSSPFKRSNRYSFGSFNEQQQSNLEEIGREIAKKCDGLPLAAVESGALLHGKLSPDDWNCVLESNIWESINCEVHAALESSYHYLSNPLKHCFACCSIFPKKSILEKKMVVQLWIAEGLVESSTDQQKVGEEYFDVLVSRSLIQRRSIGVKEPSFEMHNLTHAFATKVSSPYCIGLDEHNLHER